MAVDHRGLLISFSTKQGAVYHGLKLALVLATLHGVFFAHQLVLLAESISEVPTHIFACRKLLNICPALKN